MMAKPMKTLKLYYPMIQFLIILNIYPFVPEIFKLLKYANEPSDDIIYTQPNFDQI